MTELSPRKTVSTGKSGAVRVLVVDDSAVARDLLARGLALSPGIEVVGQASDAWTARDAIVNLEPDVITLDVEMPRMDGIEFLRRLMPQYPMSAIIVSAVTEEGSRRALEALEAGAIDVVGKPRAGDREGLKDMLMELSEKIQSAALTDRAKLKNAVLESPATAAAVPVRKTSRIVPMERDEERPSRIIAVGASTGGTTAITRLLAGFPEDCPPTLIVQHMPPVFTAMFAATLNRQVAPDVREASDGDQLRRGLVLVAPGDYQCRVLRNRLGFLVRCEQGPKVSGHRPSVDVLFASVAEACGTEAVGILLTGMGRDGAMGLLAMRQAGARCLAQDEESSVVFGMPQEAWNNGAAERLVSLDRAAIEVLLCAKGTSLERTQAP
jgi:two-component system, chemotaxis family, protein-glutamate methylesterase/glutaminase